MSVLLCEIEFPTVNAMHQIAGWTVERLQSTPSTQTLACARPAWHAVTAEWQTAGRGQRDRRFTSDPGGLYLSAIVPYAGNALAARGFALAVGWAVRETLRRAGVAHLRLRWPNDLMIGSRKAGGILVEQAGRNTLCIGIGLNVQNRPWLDDPELKPIATRLADHVLPGCALPSHERLLELLLRAITMAYRTFERRKLAGFVPVLNRCWGAPRQVTLEFAPGATSVDGEGRFAGIDAEGRLFLRTSTGRLACVPEHHIQRLREVAG